MEIPRDISGEQPIITVLLSDKHDHIEKKFRCSVCGKVAFEYCGSLRVIHAGGSQTDKPPVIVQCFGMIDIRRKDGSYVSKRCKTKYYVT